MDGQESLATLSYSIAVFRFASGFVIVIELYLAT